uniref:LMBR1-like membrane protein n=1 Tax=Haemonchus contortus TaxID=6289 RepID=A0A7I4Y1U6_HAECO
MNMDLIEGNEEEPNLNLTSWFMRDVLHSEDGHHQLRSMCHFIAFNVFVGFFGYYVWLMFPRPIPNDTVPVPTRRQDRQLDELESDRLDDLSSSNSSSMSPREELSTN